MATTCITDLREVIPLHPAHNIEETAPGVFRIFDKYNEGRFNYRLNRIYGGNPLSWKIDFSLSPDNEFTSLRLAETYISSNSSGDWRLGNEPIGVDISDGRWITFEYTATPTPDNTDSFSYTVVLKEENGNVLATTNGSEDDSRLFFRFYGRGGSVSIRNFELCGSVVNPETTVYTPETNPAGEDTEQYAFAMYREIERDFNSGTLNVDLANEVLLDSYSGYFRPQSPFNYYLENR